MFPSSHSVNISLTNLFQTTADKILNQTRSCSFTIDGVMDSFYNNF